MKSEILYSLYQRDIRLSLAYKAEKELFAPHLSFRQVFKSSTIDRRCLEKEAHESMNAKLFELCSKKLCDDLSRLLLISFINDYGSGMGGREFRYIYSTNDNTKLIVIDEAEGPDHAVLTDRIVSLISDISTEDRKLIDSDISKLLNR